MIDAAPSTQNLTLIPNQVWLTLNSECSVATLNFHIPATRNAISLQLSDELAALAQVLTGSSSNHPLSTLIQQKTLLVLALRSHCDGVFLSGGDLREISTLSPEQGEILTQNMRSFTSLLRSGPLVSVALLNGLAVGGGSEIALAADFRLSITPSAALHFAQTRWGVPAGWGMMSDLRNKGVFGNERRRGIAMALQEFLSLPQLVEQGLIDARCEEHAAPEDAAESWLADVASRLATCPPALRTQLISVRPQAPADNLQEFDTHLFSQSWLGSEHRSRIDEYLKQRAQLHRKR